ncbi:hypothetical protein CAOG_03630 [Capsaspora owczarzaki ATCC 30864]|uniref:FAM192A/Fyv6 N-terminal domain-containing protein n=1 Tax=Capsaspora owczarzaki (strain ATCC 30864) TaxID=595528 RepID=A0A0D2WNJ9_CAPO3|nr:hypothetical protein CAOG_03630 [Capsaspora owczarzaki ATCC 30864]KJE92715.1 hypothetical protein CAOG_003630 [Capsaspora owczarzaki ATCC 30864]|eukprot:XP_004363358.1 hypothetical protein CAOG_03630 [Capsaspora owczarzaki ATCC 30864]
MNFRKGGVEQVFFTVEEERQREERAKEWEQSRDAADKAKDLGPDDGKSLFDRLEANRAAKAAEFEEKMKYKNQIYQGLDDEEFEFVQNSATKQEEIENARWEDEIAQVKQFREAVAQLEAAPAPTTTAEASAEPAKTGDVLLKAWQAQPSITSRLAVGATASKGALGIRKKSEASSPMASFPATSLTAVAPSKRPATELGASGDAAVSVKQPRLEATTAGSAPASTPKATATSASASAAPKQQLLALAAYDSDSDAD